MRPQQSSLHRLCLTRSGFQPAACIALKDEDGTYLAVDDAYCSLLRLPADRVLGHTDFDLLPHDQALLNQRLDRCAMASLHPLTREQPLTIPSLARQIVINRVPVDLGFGTRKGLLYTVVASRHASGPALRPRYLRRAPARSARPSFTARPSSIPPPPSTEPFAPGLSGDEFQAVFDLLNTGILVVDSQGRLAGINASARRALGVEELAPGAAAVDELDKHFRFGSCAATSLSRRDHPITRALRGEVFRDYTLWVTCAASDRRWIGSFSACSLHDSQGKPTLAVVTFTDVTEREMHEEHRRRTDALLMEAQRMAQLGWWELDLRDNRMTWSAEVYRMLGLQPGDVGPSIDEMASRLHADDQANVIDAVRQCAQLGEPGCFQSRVISGDGAERTVRGSIQRLAGEHPHHARLVGILQDVTEQVDAEQRRFEWEAKAQRSQKLDSLGVLAGGIAHDFNNLLVGVIGNADLALMDLPESSSARALVEGIRSAGLRASDLTAKMLAYSGRGHFTLETVDLAELVGDALRRLVHPQLPSTVSLKLDLLEGLAVEVDAAQLRQVVLNLVTNAIEAAADSGTTIVVRTHTVVANDQVLRSVHEGESCPEGVYAALEVIDTGAGMDAVTRGRIFEPFFTTKFTGRGLGLPAVLGIVRGHRGAIRVDSEPGRGTCVQVLLPLVEGARATVVPDVPTTAVAECSGLVLLADDEEIVRRVVTAMLQRGGFLVIPATDGRQAVELFERHHADLCAVLLDLTMPNMNGEEAFRRMRELNPAVPVVLASGYSEQQATQRFSGLGLAGFISKPFELATLIRKLNTVQRRPSTKAR